ncbi:unnamed protein product, partial [Chrysoparadoxa australica]
PASATELPAVCIQAVKHARHIACTTAELSALSDGAKKAGQEALLLAHDIIQELLTKARVHVEALFAMVDAVALLDMLFGFARLVATSRVPFTRPAISEGGPLRLQGGLHPVIALATQGTGRFTPTDVALTPYSNLSIVTGPNGSGKSTLLRTT